MVDPKVEGLLLVYSKPLFLFVFSWVSEFYFRVHGLMGISVKCEGKKKNMIEIIFELDPSDFSGVTTIEITHKVLVFVYYYKY